MPSCWIERRPTSKGERRYRVRFRVGGRESVPRLAGSFTTMRQAQVRRAWVLGELAAMRVPDLAAPGTSKLETLRTVCERWRTSRVDVADGTAATYDVNLGRIIPRLGERAAAQLRPDDVAGLVAELVDQGLARESIRKTLTTLAQALDFAGIEPNPVRDRTVKLPREERAEVAPPSAAHVLAVHAILPISYRLPLLVLDATGMRVGELEQLTWGDVDEQRGRWRVSRTVAKTGRARWVLVPPELFVLVLELCPRDDRAPARRVFEGVTADRLRTAIARACTASGVPSFSPHDLRHRRISLEHLRGVPWARIGELVGQRNLAVTANTYTHVLTEETELDYSRLSGGA